AVDPETPDVEAVGGANTGHERAAREGREHASADAEADTNAAQTDPDTDDPAAPTELDPSDDAAWAVDDVGGEDGTANGSTAGQTERGLGDAADDARPSPRSWQDDAAGRDVEPPTGGDEAPSGADEAAETVADAVDRDADASDADTPPRTPAVDEGPDRGDGSVEEDASVASEDATRPTARTRPATRQRTLDGDGTESEREFDSLPSLRVLGQLHETYVVAEAPDGLVLIDQHAADERVNYERLKAAFADGADAQALAEPVRIELTAREAALFEEFVDDLSEIGFRAERAGDREVAVTAVPAVFDAALDPDLLRDVLSALVDDAAAGDEPVADVVDELLADLACYPSVTGNTSLTEGRVVDLLDRLDACENPYACPHGRPVVIRLDRDEIGSRFERDYPGHGGRRAEGVGGEGLPLRRPQRGTF
ncbi:DNA mismatch repair protein MutL, partial [Halorubrum sp. C3]